MMTTTTITAVDDTKHINNSSRKSVIKLSLKLVQVSNRLRKHHLVWIAIISLFVFTWSAVRTFDVYWTSSNLQNGVQFAFNATPHGKIRDYLEPEQYITAVKRPVNGNGGGQDLMYARYKNTLNNGHHDATNGEQVRDTILHTRVKRSVLNLASMIKCVTGCNPFSYKDYGCYCGFQGDGYPVDGIDSCCYMHDHCYSQVDCHQAMVYFKSYKWSCMNYGRAKCYFTRSMCGFQLCECDRKFAKCLRRYSCPHEKAECDISRNIILGKLG